MNFMLDKSRSKQEKTKEATELQYHSSFHHGNSEVGGIAYFSCNFCRNEGQGDTFAQALRVDDDDNGIPNYELQRWPRDANFHNCHTTGYTYLVKEFRELCYAAVKNDPTKSVLTIYKESRATLSRDMKSEDQKKVFFAELPSYEQINSGLYKYRQNFIPRAPMTFVSHISYKL